MICNFVLLNIKKESNSKKTDLLLKASPLQKIVEEIAVF